MAKKVLMTNLYLQKYTGSELHTVELARQFKKHGFEVTIAVYSKSYPLLELCDEFKVIECQHETLTDNYFDIVFIQHFPVYDYLCAHYEIKYSHLIVSILSSFNEYETLPECYSRADLITAVSKECADIIRPYSEHIFLFQNSVENHFFESYSSGCVKELKKICIISNHVPEELYELKDIMDEYTVSYIGIGNDIKLVTPEVLHEFDLVITIGRTVQQCFACGIPVFVYDYFGGAGYIDSSNIELAQKHNFSGRGFDKMTAIEIKERIVSGYLKNFENLNSLMLYAKENFNLDHIFNEMLNSINMESKQTYALSRFNNLEKARLSLYTKSISLNAYLNKNYCQKSQIYVDYGQGFNEDDSLVWNICSSYPIVKTLSLEGVRKIRFDPTQIPSKCKLTKIVVNNEDKTNSCIALNSSYSDDNIYYFLNYDSQFLLEVEGVVNITLFYSYEPLSALDYNIVESSKIKEEMDLQSQINDLRMESQRLYFKLHPVKRLLNKIKNKA